MTLFCRFTGIILIALSIIGVGGNIYYILDIPFYLTLLILPVSICIGVWGLILYFNAEYLFS